MKILYSHCENFNNSSKNASEKWTTKLGIYILKQDKIKMCKNKISVRNKNTHTNIKGF